jgi:hypothetical protein
MNFGDASIQNQNNIIAINSFDPTPVNKVIGNGLI